MSQNIGTSNSNCCRLRMQQFSDFGDPKFWDALRSHPHTPDISPTVYEGISFCVGLSGSLEYLPRVCGQNHWPFCFTFSHLHLAILASRWEQLVHASQEIVDQLLHRFHAVGCFHVVSLDASVEPAMFPFWVGLEQLDMMKETQVRSAFEDVDLINVQDVQLFSSALLKNSWKKKQITSLMMLVHTKQHP